MGSVTPTDARPITCNLASTLNSIHKNHNIPSDKGAHSLLMKRQIPTKAYDCLLEQHDIADSFPDVPSTSTADDRFSVLIRHSYSIHIICLAELS